MGGFTHKRSSLLETVALLVLCVLFVVLAIAAIATGVNAYNGTVKTVEDTSTHRTALAYISNQVRAADSDGAVDIVRLFGVDALALKELAYGEGGEVYEYRTYIYCYGGWLRELYTEYGLEEDMIPGVGTELVEMDSVSFSFASGGLIQATVRRGNTQGSTLLSLGSGEEVAP